MDWLPLVVSALSLFVAGLALYKTTLHNAEMRQYASAGPDIALAGQITQARTALSAIAIKMAEITKGKPEGKLTPTEQRKLLDLQPAYEQAVEALFNAFELACRLYRDGSLNRDRFRRHYQVDVRDLFEDGTESDRQRLLEFSSPYTALRAVYQEWFNPEK